MPRLCTQSWVSGANNPPAGNTNTNASMAKAKPTPVRVNRNRQPPRNAGAMANANSVASGTPTHHSNHPTSQMANGTAK